MTQNRFFFNHLRKGVRTALTSGPMVEFNLILAADGIEQEVQIRDLQVAGPEHARGIVPTAVRKHYPANESADLRAGELPYIEWKDPALPWALTLRTPTDGCLSPFIALICVAIPTGEPDWLNSGTLPLPRAVVKLPDGLPDPAVFELMAHIEDPAQPVHDMPGPRAFSRLLCPQRLKPRTRYRALVVPLFEAGRLTGLGEPLPDGGSGDFAWAAGDTSATLPVYLSWQFNTGISRGAEDMLRALFAVPPKGDLPRVPVDSDSTRELLPPLVGRKIEKRAVFAVQPPSPQQTDSDLTYALNVSAAQAQGRLPMPAYGRWFAKNVEPGSSMSPLWYDGVNLDASLRIMAGYGAAIVRRRQEEIVTFVLDSAGQIEEANAILSRAHTAMALTSPLHESLSTPMINTSALNRLIGPAAARTQHAIGSIGRYVDSTVDGVLQDPSLHRVMAAGGALDRNREPRMDPADAIRGKAATAAKAPTVPGASPIRGAITALDAATTNIKGVIDVALEGGSIEFLLGLVVSGKLRLREDKELGDAHNRRRERQDEDHRRPNGRAIPGEVPSRSGLRTSIINALRPGMTVPPRILNRIDGLEPGLLPRLLLAEPVWPYPIIPELFALDPATLSPGLTNLPEGGVMALNFDAAAIDAVVLGANTEVLRELRWRGVPHDPLTSPVRRVFPAPSHTSKLSPDTIPLRLWEAERPLGEGRSSKINFVVLIRSQLFRKYPETVILLVEASWDLDKNQRELNLDQTYLPEIMGQLGDDITYVGFSQDRLDMVGDPDPAVNRPGGFLVFKQPDDGLTFGLNDDVDDDPAHRSLNSWNEVSWSDLPDPEIQATGLTATVSGPLKWGENSATMAAILVERRVTVALHVSDIAGEVL